MGLKDQIAIAQRTLREWPEWMRYSVLTVKGALLTADSVPDDEEDMHRQALKVLAKEVRRLQRKLARTVKSPARDE